MPKRKDSTRELSQALLILVVAGILFAFLCDYVHSLPSRPRGCNRPARQGILEEYRHLAR